MLRDLDEKLHKTTINCMLTDGGLGDIIASFTAVDYIHKTYKHVELLVWVPDYILDLAKNVLPNVSVRDFSTAKSKFDSTRPNINTRWNGRSSPMKMHLVDYAFHVLCDQHPTIEQKNYLKANLDEVRIGRLKLPKNYVVLTTGFTAPNREFLPKHINKIVEYTKSKNYDIVFLGKKQSKTGAKHIIEGNFKEDINYNVGLNLIDKTSLLEAAKVISKARCLIGLDNGLMHLAGMTDTIIVGGFTNVEPKQRMPIRNNILGWNFLPVVPPTELSCNFCQSRMNFLYGHDFKECYYKDLKCLELLSADLYIEQLEKIL